MTLTAQHLQIAGVVIVVLIGLALVWWLVRVTVARPKRGQTAYWLQSQDGNDPDDEIDDDDAGVHGR